MARLFGVPLEALALGAALVVAALAALLLLVLLRRPILWRLGLRNIPRRPGSSLLVVAGLALGTAVVSSALFTGDTMSYTVRALVADSLGRGDEVVVQMRLSPGNQNRRWFEALVNGAPLTAGSSYFDAAVVSRLQAALRPGSAVVALAPAIVEQAALVDLTSQQMVANANVLALPADYPAVLGALARPSGEPLALGALGPDELYANAEAANELGASEGDALQLRLGDQTKELRLAAIYATGDLGGARPTVLLPLPAYQAWRERPDQVNQILVVNRGERAESVGWSQAAAAELRGLLVDDASVDRALRALRREPARQVLGVLATSLRPAERERFQRLREALDGPDEAATRAVVREYLGDPELAARLAVVAARLPQGAGRGALFGALNADGGLRVLELKRVAQERADEFASILASIFVVLGIFSIATGLLLVFLVFALLAAGRRVEMGITRALGARQRDLVAVLLVEGFAYSLFAALVGVAAGFGISRLLVTVLQGALEPLGLVIRPNAEPRSVAFAFAAGLLLAVGTTAAAAWWTCRLNIAAAMRQQAEPSGRAARWLALLLALALCGIGGALFVLGTRAHLLLPLALGLSALVLAAERGASWLLGRLLVRPDLARRLVATLTSLALLALWCEPRESVRLLGLGRPPLVPELFPVAGVGMVLAAVWGLATNLGPLLAVLSWLTRPLRPLRLTSRLAAAYLGQHSFRAGTVMAMFALVLCSLTVSSVLLAGAQQAYGRPDAENGGYDLRAQTADPTGALDLRAALADAPAARPDDFPVIGAVRSEGGDLIRLGSRAAAWEATGVSILDSELLRTTDARLLTRAPGYGDERDVWHALETQAGLAVVSSTLATALGLAPGPLEPTTVWVRARSGGPPVRLQVVGVLAPRSPLGEGVFLSEATAAAAALPVAQQVTYFLRTREGLTPERAASALNLSFGDQGLRASLVDQELRFSRAVQAPLTWLLHGFMGLGLVSGVLAVGLLCARAVFERRSQIGMLRAVGMRAGAVQLGLLLEGLTMAVAGAGIGVAVGVVLARQVVRD